MHVSLSKNIMKTNSLQKNIQKDWKQLPVGEVFTFVKSYAYSRDNLTNGLISKDTIGNIHYGDIHSTYNSPNIDVSKIEIPLIKDRDFNPDKDTLLKDGDLVMSDASEDYEGVGVTVSIHGVGNKKVVGGLHTFVLRDEKGLTNEYYRQYIFRNPEIRNTMQKIANGVSVYGISKTAVSKIKLPLPSLPEQNRIVSVLETWDKAIEKLSKKIEVKKQIKKGLMQDLLTGKKRLKGFSEKWKNVILDDVMSSFSTGLNPRDNFKLGFGKNYYVTIKNISNGHLDFLNAEMVDDIALKLINKRSKLSKNDIIMSSIGNVGESYLLQEDPKGWDINESVFCLKPNVKIINPKFLYFTIISSETKKYFENNITGSSFRSIKMKELKNMPIIIPEINEQNAIAEILTTSDNEIQELEKKLQIIKEQKKYLLNNLITGTIRTPETLSTKLTK